MSIDYPDETWGSRVARENRQQANKLTAQERMLMVLRAVEIIETGNMSTRETRSIKLWLVGSTPLAREFLTMPPDDKTARRVWVPRSITQHISTRPEGHPGECVCDIEEWWLEKNDL